ncbi:MAG: dienelactone hydrolase family protein [Alphaproteobacteria bacterium]|nr:dienelactone hydrolase family protein [Alphaproteobacteria bacterium]
MIALLLLACTGPSSDSGSSTGDSGTDGGGDSGSAATPYELDGPYVAAQRTLTVRDEGRDRTLTVEAWYPLAEGEDGLQSATWADLIPDEDRRTAYEALLEAAPDECPSQGLQAAWEGGRDADRSWPVLLMSHCHECTRWSMATAAERLASHGFVVLAPDHDGNTLFDQLDGTAVGLDTETLAMRVDDLEAVLAAATADDFFIGVDTTRIGAVGHSFGAVTAALFTQEHPEVAAVMMVGAPGENPLLPGVDIASIDRPQLFLLLEEDHSISVAGNILIENNFAEAPGPAWLVRYADAGHWTPSDLVGLTDGFMPGCGEDERMESDETFAYVDPATGRARAGSIAAAFFAHSLDGAADGAAWLSAVSAVDPMLSVEER